MECRCLRINIWRTLHLVFCNLYKTDRLLSTAGYRLHMTCSSWLRFLPEDGEELSLEKIVCHAIFSRDQTLARALLGHASLSNLNLFRFFLRVFSLVRRWAPARADESWTFVQLSSF